MKIGFQKQFDHLKRMISQNIALISDLVKQADELLTLINSLNGSENAEVKAKLQITKDGIQETIEGLLKKTEELFDFYNQLLKEAFDK